MDSLKQAMAWDEKVYGREYDLDQFNIVAVSDFNMGAMENKSLNIFNSAYVLADQETATDGDFDNIARVVAHEYFHNWSGDRVTCRDWFQLSLKEGFTVFRDQSFSADIGSAAVKRIEDVRVLRAASSRRTRDRSRTRCGPTATSRFRTSTRRPSTTRAPRSSACWIRCWGRRSSAPAPTSISTAHDGEAATCDDFVGRWRTAAASI